MARGNPPNDLVVRDAKGRPLRMSYTALGQRMQRWKLLPDYKPEVTEHFIAYASTALGPRSSSIPLTDIVALHSQPCWIHKLPLDTLIELFQHLVPKDCGDHAVPHLDSGADWAYIRPLTAVCRKWRVMALTPCLWTYVNPVAVPGSLVPTYLNYSGRMPLDVAFSIDNFLANESIDYTLLAVNAVADRIRSLCIAFAFESGLHVRSELDGARIALADTFFTAHAPILQTMHLGSHSPCLRGEFPPIFGGHYPSMTKLCSPFDLSVILGLKHLTHLDCHSTPWDSRVVTNMLQFLRTHPEMRYLKLRNVPSGVFHTIPRDAPIALPRLETLILEGEAQEIRKLVGQLTLLTTAYCEINGLLGYNPSVVSIPRGVADVLPGDSSGMPMLQTNITRIEVTSLNQTHLKCMFYTDPEWAEYTSDGPTLATKVFQLGIQYRCVSYAADSARVDRRAPVLATLWRHVPLANVRVLTIDALKGAIAWHEFFNELPNLHILIIKNSSVEEVMHELCWPCIVLDGSTAAHDANDHGMLCPLLKRIVIRGRAAQSKEYPILYSYLVQREMQGRPLHELDVESPDAGTLGYWRMRALVHHSSLLEVEECEKKPL